MARTRDLLRDYRDLVSERSQFDTLYQEIAEYCLPHRANIRLKFHPGASQTEQLVDSTANHALDLLAGSIAGSITSPALEWFHLKFRDEAANQVRENKEWLHAAEQEMYLAFRQSNFHEEVHQFYQDLIMGTAAMFVDERPKTGPGFAGFEFKTIPWGEYVVAEAPDGRVDTIKRCFRMTAKAILQQWPDGPDEQFKTRAKDKPYQQHEVLHCVGPREFYSPSRGQYDALHMPWESKYLLLRPGSTGGEAGATVLSKGGYPEFPFMVARWVKTAGEVYGRGPAMTALPSIRGLQAARALMLRAAAKKIDPPLEVPHDGVLGSLDMEPSGLNTVEVAPGQGKPSILPIETGGSIDWSQFVIADERQMIRDIFFIEQLQLPAKANMTATEVERHYERMRRILGAILSRLESEFLNPLIDRCFLLMFRAGSFGAPPDALADPNIDVEYEGPLAKSQRSARFYAGVEVLDVLARVYAMDPMLGAKAAENFDIDAILRDFGEVRGLPANYFVGREQMIAHRQKREQQQAQQMQLAMIEQGATAAGRAAPALKALTEAADARNGQTRAA